MEPLSIAIVIVMLVAVFWAWQALFRAFKPKVQEATPPELATFLTEQIDPGLAEQRQTFRRPHVLQTVVYAVASTVILVSFLITFLSEGWSLLSLLLAVAEVLLLFTHGTPLLISVTRTLTVSREGIESRDLFGRRRIEWWEVQRFLVAEDLSRFRAEGIRGRLRYDTAVFPPETKLAVYRALRAHLAVYQQELQPWPQALPLVRFVKANALSLGVFVAVMIAAAFAGGHILPEGNVLGLRCGYASDYLRDKYDLPDRHGCVVLRVNEGTGAYEAGLREGDMIVEVEGVSITSGPQFTVYWESLDKHTQEFKVVRPREADEIAFNVTLGGHGRAPRYDPEDPYFFYLRARSGAAMPEALADFTRAIELAPDFDLAYVYRGALYSEGNLPDEAMADFNKAIALDSELSEAYRERAWLHVRFADYEAAKADSERAIKLDGCSEGFQTYNYDCHINHLSLSLSYGEQGDADNLRRGLEEAEKAAAFYPEQPRSYYLAAYYSAALDDFGRAQEYAATYLLNAEEHGEPGNLIGWAKELLNGEVVPAEGGALAGARLEPSALIVACCYGEETEPAGEPTFTYVTFTGKRETDAPQAAPYLTPDRSQLWAFFEFDNAANAQSIQWEWSQDSEWHAAGAEPWPGVNKGYAWIRLENHFPDQETENTLTLSFDSNNPLATNFSLRSDPYVGAVSFSADPLGAQALLFYAGEPSSIYAHFEYIGPPLEGGLVFVAEKDGVLIASANVPVKGSGRLTVPMAVPSTMSPGVIDVHISLSVIGKLVRKGALAITTREIASSPPFERFQIGLELDGNGGLLKITRDLSRNTPESYYYLGHLRLEPASTLSILWYINGVPFGPEFVPASFGWDAILNPVPGSSALEPGEYEVVISLDTKPVYAEVVVVR